MTSRLHAACDKCLRQVERKTQFCCAWEQRWGTALASVSTDGEWWCTSFQSFVDFTARKQ